MRPALAVVGGNAGHGAPIELREEDRVHAIAAPIRSLSVAMIVVAAGSLVAHIALMAAAVVAARAPIAVPLQHEIAVEVVREAPKPDGAKPPAAVQREMPPPPKSAAAKPEPTKREPVKPVAPAKPQTPSTPARPPAPSGDGKLKALQDELSALRAEQAALKAAQAQDGAGKALALPSIGAGDGDAIGYQQLVFSQLAKAKGDAEYRGEAGITGVRFEIDEAGKLVRVDVVRTSGKAALDAKALDIVRRAAPFPPAPTAADRIVYANVNFVPPKP